jgi:hypothetical protein
MRYSIGQVSIGLPHHVDPGTMIVAQPIHTLGARTGVLQDSDR